MTPANAQADLAAFDRLLGPFALNALRRLKSAYAELDEHLDAEDEGQIDPDPEGRLRDRLVMKVEGAEAEVAGLVLDTRAELLRTLSSAAAS